MKAIAAVLLVALLLAAPALAQSGVCAECQKVVQWLETELSSNSTLQEIEAALQTACSFVPASEQSTCDNIVTKYLPDAISWIITKATPAQACAAIHLCSSRVEATAAPTAPPAPPSTACKICEVVAAAAELYVDSHPNDTAAQVEAELEKVCNMSFLAKYKTECELLLDTEANGIISAIFAGKPASQVCGSTVPPICPSLMSRLGAHKPRFHHGRGHFQGRERFARAHAGRRF